MALTQYGYAAGITSLLLLTVSYLCGALVLTRYAANRRIEIFVQGISFFAIGSNWLAASLAFLKILMSGEPPSQVSMIYAWSWAPAATATVWIYLILSLIRPKLKLAGVTAYIVLDIIYAYLMYAKTLEYSTYQIVGGFPDLGVQGIAIVFLIFYILSAFVLIGPMYLWIGFKSNRPVTRLKGKTIGLGVMIFAFFAIFETIIGPSALLLILSRILSLCAVLLIYLGLILPTWIRLRFLTETQAFT